MDEDAALADSYGIEFPTSGKKFSEVDMERYHGVDVRPVELPNFVMREHPGGKVADRYGNITDRPISQFSFRIHAEACSVE